MKKVLFWTIMTLTTVGSIFAYIYMILSDSIIDRVLSFLPCMMFCALIVLMIMAKDLDTNMEDNNEV